MTRYGKGNINNINNNNNYGNRHRTSSASVDVESTPWWLSSFSLADFLDLADSYGFDITAMLLIFWCLVFLILIFGANLYLTLTKRAKRIEEDEKRINKEKKETTTTSEESANQSECRSTITEPIINRTSANRLDSASTNIKQFRTEHSTGTDVNCVNWIDDVIEWLFQSSLNNPNVINSSIDSWLSALNVKSSKLTIENGVYIEFVRLFRDQSNEIRFVDVNVEKELNDNIIATVKATCDRLVIQVRVAADRRDVSNGNSSLYEIELNKLSALLKVVCKPEDSLFVIRFLERPETKVLINGPLTPSEKTFSPDLIINGILNVLTSTLADINFTENKTFPPFHGRQLSSSNDNTLEFAKSNGSTSSSPPPSSSRRPIERKLFVTIVKGHNLAVNQMKEGHDIYCTIELNEPKEKRRTSSVRKDFISPTWQDHSLFSLNDKSKEILFEVFDSYRQNKSATVNGNSNQDECIGFGIANLGELRLNPSEKLSIPLQTSENGSHNGGTLEVELLLMEHKLASPSTSVYGQRSMDNNGNTNDDSIETPILATTSDHPNYYRDPSTINSTPYCLDHYTRSSLNTIKSDDNALSSEGYGTDRGITPDVTSVDLPPYSPDSTGSHGSHSRESRSLIRTIRKRLSFNKRSKSVERQPNTYRDRTTTDNGDDERARSVPGSREPSAPREMINGKKQESYLSLASNASYFAENSTLVLECIVDGEKRHYIVPVTKGNKRKIRRRKGTKLHVFNDHLFVAQHVASRIECQVCHKSFPLRIGKQGYQCRECGILTHKQCHANVESYCPANGASRLNFDLENSNSFVQSTTPLPQVRVIAPSEGSPINE